MATFYLFFKTRIKKWELKLKKKYTNQLDKKMKEIQRNKQQQQLTNEMLQWTNIFKFIKQQQILLIFL